MKKLQLLAFLSLVLSLCSFALPHPRKFSIRAHITGFEEGTKVLLIDAVTNQVKDSAYFSKERFELSGAAAPDPKNMVLYIPTQTGTVYTYLFMADEQVTVEGSIGDFPDNLTIKGSVHHQLKTEYDSRMAKFNRQMEEQQQRMHGLQQQKKWNDSLQKAYIGEGGILAQIDRQKTAAEQRFIADHMDTYYGLQILYYKKAAYTDSQLKKTLGRFGKKLRQTQNGKAIQTYLKSPALAKGDRYIDFTATDKTGAPKKFSQSFDGKKYVLLDFSTPTCPNSKAAVPMLDSLGKAYHDQLNIVTYYTENDQTHFDYAARSATSNRLFLWTTAGNDGFAYTRYRINSTPTYYLFDPSGRLIEKWSGFTQGYYDATHTKITQLLRPKQ